MSRPLRWSMAALLTSAAAWCAPPTVPPATASPALPAQAELRIQTAWNRHRAGGADNRRTDAGVLFITDGRAAIRVVDSGTDRDFSMTATPDGSRVRVETHRWHRRWAGELAPADAGAGPVADRVMTLRLDAEDCTTEVRWNQEPARRTACPASPATLALRCSPWRGETPGPLAGRMGWRCVPRPEAAAPRPAAWPWLIVDDCVRAGRDPRGRLHLRACPPPPGPPMPTAP